MWNKVQDMQKELDELILKNHGLEEQDLNSLVLATIVELAEFANDSRSFKYWMVDPKPKESLLEEAADVIHFVASIANKLNMQLTDVDSWEVKDKNDVNKHLIRITEHFSSLTYGKDLEHMQKFNVECAWEKFLSICKYFGFSQEDLFEAYLAKNKINYKRQEEKY